MNALRKNTLFIITGLFIVFGAGSVWGQTPAGTAIINTALLSYDIGDGTPSFIPSDTVVTIVSEVELDVTKSVDVQIVELGDTIVYEIHVKNIDDRPGYKVTIHDSLDQMLSYIDSEPSGEINNGIVKWQIPQINVGETVILQLSCKVVKSRYQNTIENFVQYSENQGPLRSSNIVITPLLPWPDIELSKSVKPDTVYIGDVLTYTLDVRNVGPMPLTSILVRDTLPTGIDFVSSNMNIDTANQVLVWYINNLDRTQEMSLEFQALVTSQVPDQSILNVAHVTAAEGVHDSAHASVAFRGYGIGLKIIKEAADTVYMAGDTITYDLIISNSGVRTGNQIMVRDTLPDHLEYLHSTHDANLFEDSIVVWQIDHLQPGFHDTLHVTTSIRIPIEHQTLVNNIVWARTSEGIQDSSHWEIKVNSYPNLVLEKYTQEEAFPGDTLLYSFIFANTGTATSIESVLRDTLPEYLIFIDATGTYAYDSTSHTVRWEAMNIPVGYKDTLYFRTKISESIEPNTQIINTGWLVNKTASTTAIATCETNTNPDRIFSYKLVDKKRASAGDTLTYTIHYGILVTEVADSVFITDFLPQQVQWIQDVILMKSNLQLLSYDPVTNQIRFYHDGKQLTKKDSIKFQVVVKNNIGPGIHEIENRAMVWMGSDTVYTEDDTRTEARTKLIQDFLLVKKTINRKVTEIGGILTYQVTAENRSDDSPLAPIEIVDILPEGFRYVEGTTLLEGKKANDPKLSHTGKHIRMQWTFPDTLKPGEQMKLRYRIIVGLSAKLGEHENRVTVYGLYDDTWIQSEEARVKVLVLAGAFDERGFIFGKVYEDQNRNGLHDNGEPGCKHIELIMEDGTRVKTDSFGKYSIPNVEGGQHVLRLNERTLPNNKCVLHDHFDHLGDSKSKIVLVPPGGMAKANFAVESVEQK